MQLIRNAVKSQQYSFKVHAMQRSGERKISIDQIENCLLNGQFVSSRYDQEHENTVVSVYSGDPDNIIVVVAVQLPPILIITVEDVDWKEWDRTDQTIRRK